jgi:lipoate-protein ligase A
MINVIDSGHCPAPYNMALDEFLFRQERGLYLRVYGWNPPAVSLGYGQRAKRELDLEKLKRDKISLVRRPTGGRAVLHDCEATYAVAGDIGGLFGPSLHTTYLKIGEALQAVLKILGITTGLEKARTRDKRAKSGASAPCFTSTARFEIITGGKKIMGSAQKRSKTRFLQHGSLLLAPQKSVAKYLNLPLAKKEGYRKQLVMESTSLKDFGLGHLSYKTIASAFKTGFSEALALPCRDFALSADDLVHIRTLEEKYRSKDWI